MNLKFKILNLKFFVAALGLLVFSLVFATSKDDIQYPIKILNNCANEAECKKYCGDPQPDRVKNCLQVAREHNLMMPEKIAAAERALNIVGPGGCRGPACKNYCQSSDPARMRECLRFGIENQALISEFDEDFAEEDVEEMQIVLDYLQRGGKMPPGCSDKDSCMAACQNPANIDVCMEMGVAIGTATGKMTPEQAASPAFKQMMKLMMTEGGPDGCRFDECDEVEPAKWMAWMKAKDLNPMDLIPPEAKAQMEQGIQQIEMALATAPPSAKECVEKAMGGTIEEVKAGKIMLDPSIGDAIGQCMMAAFSGGMMGGPPPGMMGFGGPPGMMGGLPPGVTGPGGCKSRQECEAYCYFEEKFDEEGEPIELTEAEEARIDECEDFRDQVEEAMESVDGGDFGGDFMPAGIPQQCQSQNPQAVMTCMMDYCMKSFMGGAPDPACMNAMRQGVSSLVGSNQLTAQSSNIFEKFVDWVLGQ